MAPSLGFTLQPDETFLALCAPLFADVDYFEIAPETTWAPREEGLVPNAFHATFREIAGARPFVAHGVGLSLGTRARVDLARQRAWQERIAADHAAFHFLWYTDHLGATSVDGLNLALPIALPMTAEAARAVKRRLLALQGIVPITGVENSAAYFLAGRALDEPAFLHACIDAPGLALLLDLHNVHTMAVNLGFDPLEYLARLDLARVIEIHLAGGGSSDVGWLPAGRTLHLDGHDAAVPEEVWHLFERVAHRCPNLRGVTLERMEGTVGERDVPLLREELRRARRVIA